MTNVPTSTILTLAASFGIALAGAPAFAYPVEVMGSSPKITIQIADATVAGGTCSALTAADQAQIEHLSRARVSGEYRVVPVFNKNPPPGMTRLAYLEPDSCTLYRSLEEMQRAGFYAEYWTGLTLHPPLEQFLGKKCIAGWSCADQLSVSFAQHESSRVSVWFEHFSRSFYASVFSALGAPDSDIDRQVGELGELPLWFRILFGAFFLAILFAPVFIVGRLACGIAASRARTSDPYTTNGALK